MDWDMMISQAFSVATERADSPEAQMAAFHTYVEALVEYFVDDDPDGGDTAPIPDEDPDETVTPLRFVS